MREETNMRIAGIDIGGTSIKLGVFDTSLGLVATEKIMTGDADPEKMADGIAEFVNRSQVELCGVGTAGNVNSREGLVTADNLRWNRVPLRDMLAERVNMRVWVDNDANAALMAEFYDGACRGVETAVQITLGTGVGGAAIINGHPWRGHSNTACEFGHIITHADGLQCACGHKGCFEAYASAKALLRITGAKTVPQIMSALDAGDETMRKRFAEYIHELSIGMTSIIMTFAPQVFVIGGGLAGMGDRLLLPIRAELDRTFAHHPEYLTCGIHLAKHGNDAGMIGAAMLALEMGGSTAR